MLLVAMAALPGPGRAEQSHVVLTPKLDWQTAQALAAWDVCASRGALFDDGRQLSRLIGRPTTTLATAVADALR